MTNKNRFALDGDDEQLYRVPERNHGPVLEPDTILEQETESETQRDPEDKKGTEHGTENEDPVEEEFKRRVDERVMKTLTKELSRAIIQDRLNINSISEELIKYKDILNEHADTLRTLREQ